jgi:hypothetical protein
MATRVQKQTAWALWLQNIAETLEPHLAEIKHQGESKLQHPELLAHGKFLHATLHWENRWAAAVATTGSKPACEAFSQASQGIPPTNPRINQHSPGHTDTSPPPKNWTINSEL